MSALTELITLKGIGPASASLLLSVYAPVDIPFFSDEAFRWVMFDGPTSGKGGGRGWDRGIKYDKKEYAEYWRRVGEVAERLRRKNVEEEPEKEEVGGREVEMVGWVLGRERAKLIGDNIASPPIDGDIVEVAVKEKNAEPVKKKRKLRKESDASEMPDTSDLRRSKRARE